MNRRRLAIAGLFGLVGFLVAAFVLWGYREEIKQIDFQAWADQVAEKGPIPFFVAMAVLPAAWFPVSPFMIGAGALFEREVAVLGVTLAMSSNMAFCWLLSGKLFRPLFERLLARFGYTAPELSKSNMVQAALLLRITPGVPFPFQNYMLGLARMPFGWYMLVSLPISLGYGMCFVFFGDALFEGDLKMILLAVSALIAASFGIRVLRERLKRKKLEEELA
ncbi:MAG: VTT domain-containing protein [Verrucomicrobiota bacterium]